MRILAAADDAVFVGFGRVAFLHGDDVVAGFLVELDHRLHAALFRLHDHVGQQQRERLVADQFARAPDGMAKAHRHLLAGEAGLPRRRLQPLQAGKLLVLAALCQRVIELELDIEMVLDDRLVAAGHEDEMLDARLARLIHHILDDRPVDDGQHLLGNSLGGREEPRAETGDRENCLANSLHAVQLSVCCPAPQSLSRDIFTPELKITGAGEGNVPPVKASRCLFVPGDTYGKLIPNPVRR